MQSISVEGCQILGSDGSREGDSLFQATRGSRPQLLEPSFANATDEEIDRAGELARQAVPVWSQVDPGVRAAFLRELAAGLEQHTAALLERAQQETELPQERLAGELRRACYQLRLFADVVEEGSWVQARCDRSDPERTGMPKPDLRRMLFPIGPVGVFGASNFPFAISVVGNDAAAAWAAGCPVIVKAHPGHPGTCELLGKCVQQVVRRLELPKGIFSLLQGDQHRVGERLVGHPAIQAIGFTGSLRGGQALWKVAQQRPAPIPFFAELGSLNPVFVFPSALESSAESLATGLAHSVAFSRGQMCTRPGFVFFCDSPLADQWIDRLVNVAASLPAGYLLTPTIGAAFEASVRDYLDDQSAQLLFPSGIGQASLDQCPPLVVLELRESQCPQPDSWWRESFGPLTVLVRCHSVASMQQMAATLPGGLTATVWAGALPEGEIEAFSHELRSRFGRLVWNGFPTGVEVGHATHHGGPFPASFDGQGTSIGTASIVRFTRPSCFQNFPERLLPLELQRSNPNHIWRLIDGQMTREPF